MYRHIRPAPAPRVLTDLALAVWEDDKTPAACYRTLLPQTLDAVAQAMKRPEFATSGSVATVYPPGGPVQRVYILRLGKPEKFTAETLRLAMARLTKLSFDAKVTSLHVDLGDVLGDKLTPEAAGRALGEAATLANFAFDRFKGAAQEKPRKPQAELKLSVPPSFEAGLRHGLTTGESANLARELAATPPNVANPAYLAKYCQTMASEVGLKCTVIDHKQAAKLNMGGLLAVGQAGSTPPVMIVLHWPGKTSRPSQATQPLLLVGKAITFDTGGYSLKINNGMLGMKYDKCGGMAVIGAMHAIARLKLPTPVVGIIAAAENMVDSAAYRPNDIITFHNGVTCEVTNTDAEGRLVLADALSYGISKYQPQAVVDLATLTGGVVVALGGYCAGVFCNDAILREQLMSAADATGERLWHLPLWDEHRDMMKGSHSDIVNSSTNAGRGAHPIQGAAFLSYFVAPGQPPSKWNHTRWAHIDIAGVADVKESSALYASGPTGYGVRLCTQLVETWR